MSREERVARAKRVWEVVLRFPCTSSVCDNQAEGLCTNGRGNERLQPHKQRIAAAVKAGACDWDGRTGATARPYADATEAPAQAGTGNPEGSRIEALDDMTDPTNSHPSSWPRWHTPQVNTANPEVVQLLPVQAAVPVVAQVAAQLDPVATTPEAAASVQADVGAAKPNHGEVRELRDSAIKSLHAYRQGLRDLGAVQGAIERVENALRAIGAVV